VRDMDVMFGRDMAWYGIAWWTTKRGVAEHTKAGTRGHRGSICMVIMVCALARRLGIWVHICIDGWVDGGKRSAFSRFHWEVEVRLSIAAGSDGAVDQSWPDSRAF
jgi:hypothetical protein